MNCACSPTFLFGLCVGIVYCLGILIMLCASVVFCLRCRVRVAPPVDEPEDEGSFQDEFLPPEPSVRRRGRGRARGRSRVASRRRQRGL